MQDKFNKIFFSGIAGSGMSAIASFMADKGKVIAGSDRAFDRDPDHPLKKIFQSRGICIAPQDGSGLDQTFDLAVFSTAVEADRPETVKARALGIPVKTRPDFLAEITGAFQSIAVSGTSGKSTASGMLAFLMHRLGLDPNFIGGGRVRQFKTASNPGNALSGSSDYLIIEACESDGSIVNYRPEHSIILNLALDHHSVDRTAGMFQSLIQHTRGKVLMNADDSNLATIRPDSAVTFSLDAPSDYRADAIVDKGFSSEFTIHRQHFTLSLPGRHNLCNAAASIALLAELGTPLKDIAAHLPEFNGIERRFTVHLDEGTSLVIDDYAHNPHKIAALMDTVMKLGDSVCYIFQPHGFGPTRMLKDEYIRTFSERLRDADHLILLPIYYAGGTAGRDISSHDLAEGIKAEGRSAEVIENREDILNKLSTFSVYTVFGARDESLSRLAEDIAGTVRIRKTADKQK